ncbi:MAG: redox-regulated ATPase YchF [Sphingobacteriia bacterium]|nr:redox-regulated ATPase YchF [Sphingobacteriia bacterium]
MGFKCGIVGLPNVGKSTLFNALSSAKAEAANYPFCTIEPNLGVIVVPDERLDKLAELVKPQQVQPTVVQIVDIAGLVRGASKGEGLGNQFLANIRECDAILHVLRCFEDGNIIHVENRVDPVRDKEIIDTELQLKDLETLEKRIQKTSKNLKGGASRDTVRELEILDQYKKLLNEGRSARELVLSEEDQKMVSDLGLITTKPVLYVCNVDEASVVDGNEWVEKVKAAVAAEQAGVIIISAAIESQIAVLEDAEERKEYLEAIGLSEPGMHRLIRDAYNLLRLQTYFTAGVKEVRAWTIPEGTRAPQAAGVIHTDFEKGFIRAEVIKYADFITLGSELAVKEAGKLAVQGKDYIVADGDILHFRFNV